MKSGISTLLFSFSESFFPVQTQQNHSVFEAELLGAKCGKLQVVISSF